MQVHHPMHTSAEIHCAIQAIMQAWVVMEMIAILLLFLMEIMVKYHTTALQMPVM